MPFVPCRSVSLTLFSLPQAVAAHPADATPATPFLQLKMACLHMEGARMDQASRIYEELLLAYQGDEVSAIATSVCWDVVFLGERS